MAMIDTRLKRIEGKLGAQKKTGTDSMLNALHEAGFDDVRLALAAQDTHEGRSRPVPFYVYMSVMADEEEGHFVFERYRGLVPDEVIRQAYNHRRNWYSRRDLKALSEDAARVLYLAGVIDEERNLMPGYLLLDNGCIADAPKESNAI